MALNKKPKMLEMPEQLKRGVFYPFQHFSGITNIPFFAYCRMSVRMTYDSILKAADHPRLLAFLKIIHQHKHSSPRVLLQKPLLPSTNILLRVSVWSRLSGKGQAMHFTKMLYFFLILLIRVLDLFQVAIKEHIFLV